jgi:hypothetical protein
LQGYSVGAQNSPDGVPVLRDDDIERGSKSRVIGADTHRDIERELVR